MHRTSLVVSSSTKCSGSGYHRWPLWLHLQPSDVTDVQTMVTTGNHFGLSIHNAMICHQDYYCPCSQSFPADQWWCHQPGLNDLFRSDHSDQWQIQYLRICFLNFSKWKSSVAFSLFTFLRPLPLALGWRSATNIENIIRHKRILL